MTTAQNSPSDVTNVFKYDGETGKVYGIWFLNIVLSILTLGIYSFWGKTRIRQYVAGSFSFAGDRFEYTGTGKELFLGFLKACPILVILYGPLVIWPESPFTALLYWPIFYLFFVATFSALRYRLSRTTWRGIRGKLQGSAISYANLKLVRLFLNIISFGLLIPASDIKVYRRVMGNTHLGNTKFEIGDVSAGVLFKSNIITLLLAIPTLGLSRFWYSATSIRYLYSHTTINGLRLKATHTGGSLFALVLGNMTIMAITLGFGMPIVIQRNMNYLSRNVFIIGDVNTTGIEQSDQALGESGEGLDAALDIDSGLI